MTEQKAKDETELIQYYVVNTELGMSGPKLGAQIGHGATICAKTHGGEETFEAWYANEQKKILLAGKEKDLIKLAEKGFILVIDNGHTEIPPGSKTVVALPPMRRSDAKPFVKGLQLLKERQ